jgi:hypothetical protein
MGRMGGRRSWTRFPENLQEVHCWGNRASRLWTVPGGSSLDLWSAIRRRDAPLPPSLAAPCATALLLRGCVSVPGHYDIVVINPAP